MKRYEAPWSTSLIVMTLAVSALMGFIVYQQWPAISTDPQKLSNYYPVIPLLVYFACALFTIRGYVITPDAILVKRLLWSTRLPRSDLQSADYQPRALRGSWRTLGNGGIFSWTGRFRSSTLGPYRALMTDPARAVILRYPRRTVVVTPGEPESFARELTDASPTA